MQEWCLQHPWMTLVISVLGLESAASVLRAFALALKKPETTSINLNGQALDLDSLSRGLKRVSEDSEDLN
jgi:hypothetical protein